MRVRPRVHRTAPAVAPGPGIAYLLLQGRPCHLRAGPPGTAPLITPLSQQGCAPRIARNVRWPDPHCSSGFRLTQQSGAWSAAAPSSLRSGGAAVFPVATAAPTPHRAAARRTSLEPTNRARIAALGQPVDTMLRSGLGAASFMLPITRRGRASPMPSWRSADHPDLG